MHELQALLARIPVGFKPVAAIGVGAFLLVLVVLLHGAGLHSILVLHRRRVRHFRLGPPRVARAMLLFGWAVFLMLALHVAGFAMWAYSLLFLGLIKHAADAIYFSANAYTTLGLGNVDLDKDWRNISPIIAISGLFTFAWTTSALVDVVAAHRELINLLEDERERQIKMRFALRKDQWNALKTELHAEQSEKEKTRAQAAGTSFSERRQIWRDERARVKKLREAKTTEVAELRRKEREEEAKLVPVVPPEKPGDSK